MGKTIVYQNDSTYCQILVAKDPYLKPLFETVKRIELTLSDDYFLSLCSAIISQQLSGKVARIIYDRFLIYYNHDITPSKLLETDTDELRSLGISFQKITYLKSLAKTIIDHDLHLNDFESMTDEAIISELVKVKGIGPWTAQMFLMFSLGREDVTAPLDLGLRKAYSALRGMDISIKAFEAMSQAWMPYRSIVSHFLWHFADKPKEEQS